MRMLTILCVLFSCHTYQNGVNAIQGLMRLGDECADDSDCSDILNAKCDTTSEMCTCRESHVSSSNDEICLKLATKLGDECDIPEQCTDIASAVCVNHICVSTEDGSSEDSVCVNDSQCSTGSCQEGHCVELSTNEPKTLDHHILGKPCSSDAECNLPGSVCTEQKKCLCGDNLVPSQNLKLCLPQAQALGDECIESVQCMSLSGSVCMNLKCTAKITNFLKETNDMESGTLTLGKSCEEDSECSLISHSVCKENICQCTEDHVSSASSESCLPTAKKEGDNCSIDKQCENIQGTVCSGNQCIRLAPVGRSLESSNSAVTWKVSEMATTVLVFVITICYV